MYICSFFRSGCLGQKRITINYGKCTHSLKGYRCFYCYHCYYCCFSGSCSGVPRSTLRTRPNESSSERSWLRQDGDGMGQCPFPGHPKSEEGGSALCLGTGIPAAGKQHGPWAGAVGQTIQAAALRGDHRAHRFRVSLAPCSCLDQSLWTSASSSLTGSWFCSSCLIILSVA